MKEMPDLIECGDPYQVAWKAVHSGAALRIPVVGFYHSHFPDAYLRTAAKFGGTCFRDAVMSFAEDYIVKLYGHFTATLVLFIGLTALCATTLVRGRPPYS